MKIDKIELHHISMKLKHPFTISSGTQYERPCVIVAVYSEGLTGWGETVAFAAPFYSYETTSTCWLVLKDFLCPLVAGKEFKNPQEINKTLKAVKGHDMAKAALENACWDLFAKAENKSLKDYIGGVRDRVKVGVSIGIQPSTDALLKTIDSFVNEGYQRVKIKIKKGLEYELMSAARENHPDIMLMADANSDYDLSDIELLKKLDNLNLLMIEQPLRDYDIIDHAKLQRELKTPVCLDESIHRPDDARYAIELKACRIINIKVGRVGGLCNAITIHDMAQKAGIDLWCGGMFETGVGRATNIAMATLPNFTLPGDISATDRYYHSDITEDFKLNKEDSTMTVPAGPGIGVDINMKALESFRKEYLEIK